MMGWLYVWTKILQFFESCIRNYRRISVSHGTWIDDGRCMRHT
jgi:hypothetical protein